MKDMVAIGTVAKAQGIKGEVKVMMLSDEKALFKRVKRVTIGEKVYNVESVKNLSNGIFFKLEGIDDRNSAELLRGKDILCGREDLPKLPEGRYLVTDMIGCNIFADGILLGTLTDILQNGSADVYCVQGADKKGDFMFPCLKKVLKRVDVDAREIELDANVLGEIAVYED